MASAAAASRPPAPPPPPPPPPQPPAPAAVQWLGPRVSFSLEDAGGGAGGREAAVAVAAAGGKAGPSAGADFEFLLGGCAAASMLPADELFSGGKLVPLRIPAPPAEEEAAVGAAVALSTALPPKQAQAPVSASVAAQQPEEAKGVAVVGGVEPKIPARRWRDLLRLRKQQASSGSGSAAAASASSEPRPLRRLLRRGPKPLEPEPFLSLPLLREAGPDEPADKTAEKATPAPAPAPISTTPTLAAPPPSQQHQNLPPKIRLPPSQQAAAAAPPPPPPPPPPAVVAADSPRLNAAGKVVFNGLGRSSSSPSSLAGGRRGHRAGGAMERSYSAHVRVAPVLNVPVYSLRGSRKSVSVFGIDRLFSPSAAAAASSSSGAPSSAGGTKKNKAAKKDVPAAGAAPQ